MYKPIASLSLDLDNRWSYLKTHGDPGWESFPSYLDVLTERVLSFLAERHLKITFFAVGQDVVLAKNRASFQAIAQAGHELANHSFSHEPWLHLHSREQVNEEIARTEEAIFEVTGERTIGFRGPGFSCSETTLDVLASRGYLYDASTFPTFVGPLARLYYFLTSDLDREELDQRKTLFGSVRDGFRPLRPYRWRDARGLIEVPVTTMPLLRFPIHLSYVLYLSGFSLALASSYFRLALRLCRWRGIEPSLLLHPLDFFGREDGVGLDFFPAMHLKTAYKLAVLAETLEMYTDQFRVATMREHALEAAALSPSRVVARYMTPSASH